MGTVERWRSASSAAAADIDLAVTSVAPLTVPVCAGSTPTIRAFIRNNGSADSGSFNIRWVVDGGTPFDGGTQQYPAGVTDTHDHIWSSGPGPGPHQSAREPTLSVSSTMSTTRSASRTSPTTRSR
jgi:hypothetical protein